MSITLTCTVMAKDEKKKMIPNLSTIWGPLALHFCF